MDHSSIVNCFGRSCQLRPVGYSGPGDIVATLDCGQRLSTSIFCPYHVLTNAAMRTERLATSLRDTDFRLEPSLEVGGVFSLGESPTIIVDNGENVDMCMQIIDATCHERR